MSWRKLFVSLSVVWSLAILFASQTAQATLIAHYALNGNAQDSSGNNAHGTEVGALSYTLGAPVPGGGQALSIDSDSEYIYVTGAGLALIDFSYPITVSVWVFPTTSDLPRAFLYSGTTGGPRWIMRQNGTASSIYTNNKYEQGGNFNINAWNHIAITRDAAGAGDIYLNGADTGNITAGPPGSGGQFLIGTAQFGSLPFRGLIDEAFIYDTVLTAAEIENLRLFNDPSYIPEPATGPLVGLGTLAVAMWRRSARRTRIGDGPG